MRLVSVHGRKAIRNVIDALVLLHNLDAKKMDTQWWNGERISNVAKSTALGVVTIHNERIRAFAFHATSLFRFHP